MNKLVQRQKDFFNTNATKPYAFRIRQLKRLKSLIVEYEDKIAEALYNDLHKSSFESYSTEIGFCLSSLSKAIKQLKKWMKPQKAKTPLFQLNTKSYIRKDPLGTVLIIGPYNYPFQLIFEPLIGAIAAGNTAIVKPSEMSAHTEKVILEIINEHFDPEYLHAVHGDASVTQELLEQEFNHIFFTGSTRVGKIIYEAASKHLTPVTLELGGKSPTIVDKNVNIKIAARRIAFGKFINAGQSCVAPDYIYVHEEIHDEFMNVLQTTYKEFYSHFDDFGHIINKHHFQRILRLINQNKVLNEMNVDESKLAISPTILKDVTWDDPIMKEEIFGPVLPVLKYRDIDEVITRIKQEPKPLALYLFTKDKGIQEKVLDEIPFGGGSVNDTMMHFANTELPFGGVGQSGLGNYHGKYSFDLFSHSKSYIKRSFLWDPSFTYPPYNSKKESLIRRVLK